MAGDMVALLLLFYSSRSVVVTDLLSYSLNVLLHSLALQYALVNVFGLLL